MIRAEKLTRKGLFFGLSLLISDILVLCLSFFLAFLPLDPATIGNNVGLYYIYSIIGILLIIIVFSSRRLYSYRYLYSGMGENSISTLSIIIGVFAIIILNYYFNRDGYQLSRLWLIYSAVISIFLIMISRAIVKRAFFAFLARTGALTRTLVIGANEEGKRIAHTFSKSKIEKNKVVGLLTDEYKEVSGNEKLGDFRILGNLGDITDIVRDLGVQRIIISTPNLKYFDILNLLDRIGDDNVEVQMSPSLFEFSVSRMKMFEYMGVPLIQIQKVSFKFFDRILKSIIDLMLGIFLFIIFAVLYPVIGLVIKLDSKGPVLYSQPRYGKDFKRIKIYKFRTMRTGADTEKKYTRKLYSRDSGFKLKEDPRITRVGKLLRKTSLDELPQILNIVRGEMSVIGPRALAIEEAEQLKDWEKKRMMVNQGITGLWQVSGRSDVDYDERMKLDLYYIQNWSIWLELKIVALTIMKMFRGIGAY